MSQTKPPLSCASLSFSESKSTFRVATLSLFHCQQSGQSCSNDHFVFRWTCKHENYIKKVLFSPNLSTFSHLHIQLFPPPFLRTIKHIWGRKKLGQKGLPPLLPRKKIPNEAFTMCFDSNFLAFLNFLHSVDLTNRYLRVVFWSWNVKVLFYRSGKFKT